MSDDDLLLVRCPLCGDMFEDIRVAVTEHGGWCPRCDRPSGHVDAWQCCICGSAHHCYEHGQQPIGPA